MRVHGCIVVLAILLVLPGRGRSEIIEQSITDDPRSKIFFEVFGFDEGGKFQLDVHNAKVKTLKDPTGVNKRGFLVKRIESRSGSFIDDPTVRCPLVESEIGGLEKIVLIEDAKADYHLSFPIGKGEEGFYATFYVSCQTRTLASFDLKLVQTNTEGYLSAGKKNLPTVFLIFCGLNALALSVWVAYMWMKRSHVLRIHVLMALLVLLKVLFLLFETWRLRTIEREGKAPHMRIPYYIFCVLESTMLFLVLLLIGTGWSFMKPFLNDREKTILKIVVPLQIVADISMIITGELSPGSASLSFWNNVSRIVDIVCCCAVLLPIVWSIRHLKEGGLADGKATSTLRRLEAFRTFYISTVVYVYFTRIVIVLLRSVLGFRHEWVADVIAESASLIFYILVGYQFRPAVENPYMMLGLEDMDGIQMGNTLEVEAEAPLVGDSVRNLASHRPEERTTMD